MKVAKTTALTLALSVAVSARDGDALVRGFTSTMGEGVAAYDAQNHSDHKRTRKAGFLRGREDHGREEGRGFRRLDMMFDYTNPQHSLHETKKVGSYWHRMLDEDGNLRPPNETEVAELLSEEIGTEKSENGTFNAMEALAKIAEKIITEAEKNGPVDDSQLEMLADEIKMVRGDKSCFAVQPTECVACLPGKLVL